MIHPGLVGGPIYLDYNATTPVDPRAVEVALPYLTTQFGNPSSGHHYARAPREAIAQARAQLATLLNAQPAAIVFTGGGSESDTLAIRGAARAQNRRHVITQPTEHPAVLRACRSLQADGLTVTYLPLDRYGRVSPADLDSAVTPDTALVSISYVNGETGTAQPIADLAAVARRHGVLFHTDAAQAVGKVPIDVAELKVDLLTVVGHKMYAPKGVGALYVRAGVPLDPVIHGGGQEGGLRSGTENVAMIAAFGAAAEIAQQELPGCMTRLALLRDLLHNELDRLLPGLVRLNGHPEQRLPGTLNVSIAGVRGRALLAAIPGIAAATGSACHEGVDTPSPVLLAMGLPAERANSAVRLTLGRWTTEREIMAAARLIARAVASRHAAGGMAASANDGAGAAAVTP